MPTPQQIVENSDFDPSTLQIVAERKEKPIEIVDYNPEWPTQFLKIKKIIQQALENRALSIEHVGSTSVPGLPAKDIIDVDLVVADSREEDDYVPLLEAAGFQFLFREPQWNEHRFLGFENPYANLHVFSPDSPEFVRHRIFRDWLCNNEQDRLLYAKAKLEAAEYVQECSETGRDYNFRKQTVLREILDRVFKAHGLAG